MKFTWITLDGLKALISRIAGLGDDLQTLANTVNSALAAHANRADNPHGVTAAQVGAVPTSRTVNGKALSANITLSASDVGTLTTAEIEALIDRKIAAHDESAESHPTHLTV